MDSDRELKIARAAVESGWLTSEQLRQCLAAQFGAGASSKPLTELLVDRGMLTPSQVSKLEQKADLAGMETLVTPPPGAANAPPRRPPSPVSRSRPPTGPTAPVVQHARHSRHSSRVPSPDAGAPPPPPEIPEEAQLAAKDPRNLYGKYILVNQVGSGGFGAVYRAWQRDLTRWVAIKFLHSEDPEDVQRFVREAQTAAKLKHPGIVGVYEVSVIDKRTYIAMEYVDGKPLGKVRLTPKAAIEAVRDAARAVSYANAKGIVHRDLKPGNLLYENGGRVCVMDFGLARNVHAAGNLTVSGTIVGTPAYMSPEQARGDLRAVTHLSDIYSLGATLYDLITGQPPFEGGTPYDIVRKVVETDPIPPSKIAPRVPRDVETIILKAMDKDRNRRYVDAAELADDLQAYLDGKPVQARPVGPVERAWKRVKRNPVVSSAIAVALLALLGGGTFGIVSLVKSARSLERAAISAKQAEAAARREAEQAEARRLASEKAAASEKVLSSIAMMVTGVERVRIHFYRPVFHRGDYEREVSRLRELLAKFRDQFPTRPEPDYLLGRLHLESDELEPAEAAFRRALEKDPRFSAARAALGRALFEKFGDLVILGLQVPEANEKIAGYRDALDVEQKAALAGEWADLPGVQTDRLLLEVVAAIVDAFRTNRFDEVLKAAEAAYDSTRDEEFLRIMALPCLKLGRIDDAIAVQTRALEARPSWAKVLNERAVMWASKAQESADLGSLFQAERDLQKALEINPNLDLAHRNQAFKYAFLKKWDEAFKSYAEAIRLRPAYLYFWERMDWRRKAGRTQEALQDAEELVKRWPDYATSWSSRAQLRLDLGDSDGASADLRKAVEIRPDDPLALIQLAKARAAASEYEEAAKIMSKVIETHPRWADGYAQRALFRKKKADILKAADTPGWRTIYLEVKPDLDRYFSLKPGRGGTYYETCKSALAEVSAALSSRD